ncbi:hypothetical protein ACHAWX_000678 [Stephanocyclus meneghinianus]
MKELNQDVSVCDCINDDSEVNPQPQSKSLDCPPKRSLHLGQKSHDAISSQCTDSSIPMAQPQPQRKPFRCTRSRRATVDAEPKSFREAARRNHIQDGIQKNSRPLSNSFSCSRHRRCSVHAEVVMNSLDEKCPQCAGASSGVVSSAKESQLSSAERVEEIEWTRVLKKFEQEDGERNAMIRSVLQHSEPTDSKPPHKKANPKHRRSSAPTDIPSRESFIRSNSSPGSKGKADNREDDNTSSPCQFKLGQEADGSDVAVDAPREILIQIARLKVNDGAFIKRSGNDWTYATLKARIMGDDPLLVFTVNEKGSTKSFPMSHWAKNIRIPGCRTLGKNSDAKKKFQAPKDDQSSSATGNATHMKSFFSALKTIQAHPIDTSECHVMSVT